MLFETLNISKSDIEREYFRHCGIKRSHYLLKKRYEGIFIKVCHNIITFNLII